MRLTYRNIAAFFLLLFLVACTKEQSVHIPVFDISFSPAIISSTRAADAGYPIGEPFEVWAYSLPKGKKWSSCYSDATQLAAKHKVIYNGEEWLPTPSLRWPANYDITFFASSPQSVDFGFTKERGVTIENFDATSALLPLFTEPVADCDAYKTQGYIALPFKHALSKVEFEVRSVIVSDSIIKLKSLCLDNITYKGNFSSQPFPSWEPLDNGMSVEFCGKETIVDRVATHVGSLMLMGQTINHKAALVVDILDMAGNIIVHDRKIETPLITDEWHAGKYYKYIIDLTTAEASFDTHMFERFNL